MLFVPGLGHGAWAFAEHWLEHAAARGFAAYAVSLRARGAAPGPEATCGRTPTTWCRWPRGLPRQAVLVGHGAGALVVAYALGRYPARAAVLAAPVLDGWPTLGAALRTNPVGTLPALSAGRLRPEPAGSCSDP